MISAIVHAIGGYYVAPNLKEVFYELPMLTIQMLFASSLSQFTGILYVYVRSRAVPKILIRNNFVSFCLSGVVAVWLISVANMLFSGRYIPFAHEILSEKSPYLYINAFILIVVGPCFEETLYRGYYFEILKSNFGNLWSILISSLLFILFHAIWGGFDINLIFIFLYSILFSIVYIQNGLIASTLVHAFVNFYLLYTNIGV